MKTSSLHDFWSSPDNTRLTAKQYSFRLPVHVAAKIAALCDMYPTKTRTQIVADLLTSALDDMEKHLPKGLGVPVPIEEVDYRVAEHLGEEVEQTYRLGGPQGRFRDLANQHFEAMELEMGNDSPEPIYEHCVVTESSINRD